MEKIRLGISSCLLGNKVRYDGGHQLEPFIVDTLGKFADFTPVCPEVECGLTVPREAMRLVGAEDAPRLLAVRTKIDYTDQMLAWAHRRVRELERENLSGFIFKSKSPSSGMERVKVYPPGGQGSPLLRGVGLFARIFMEHFPLLPVEDEGRLHDPALRENFIERIFVFRRWRDLRVPTVSLGNLVDFHTRHKLQILAHSTKHYRLLGKIVAQGKERPLQEVLEQYQSLLLEALGLLATRSKNTNVLQHIMGILKRSCPRMKSRN
jgi:uncharacterized protein YbbK (DUF523 family)